MSTNPITVAAPRFDAEVESLVLEVLRSGRLAQGPYTERFEQLCAEMAGATHAIAVSNGTVSLEIAIEALGLGPGDEIITTPLTFAATINAALRSNVTVRLVDVTDDFTIDPAQVEAAVRSNTSAVMPVHLYGLPADMAAIGSLCAKHNLAIIEDAAQAHGATFDGKPVGSFGVGSFSFYATKNVTTGEGGVVTTNDDEIARRVRILRNQGMAAQYEYVMIGRNARMTEIQAAIGIPQLTRLAELNAKRTSNAEALRKALDGAVDGLVVPSAVDGRTHVWHQFTVLLPQGAPRDEVVAKMRESGVFPGVYYPRLVHEYDAYRGHPLIHAEGEMPVARDVTSRCVSLPVHDGLSAGDIERVAQSLLDALR